MPTESSVPEAQRLGRKVGDHEEEETIVYIVIIYIASGGSVSNLSGNSNKIDHYRKA